MRTPDLELRIRADPAEVPRLLDRVEDYAEKAGLTPGTAHRLAVVCEELATNVAVHGAPRLGGAGLGGAGYVAILLRRTGAALHVIMEDDGPPFDPLVFPAPDTGASLEARQPGGLGVHLVRTLARDLRYERAGPLNRLSLVLDAEASPPLLQPRPEGRPMQIAETGTEGLRLVKLEGRLDTATAPEVEAGLLALLPGAGMLVDLAGVRFVSSAGLRVLLKAAKAAKGKGRHFAVCGLQPPVREVFEISGFDRIMQSFPDRDEALAALR